MTEEEKLESIKNGLHTELYAEWAKNDSYRIRVELAMEGYEHDQLVNDPETTIRRIVMYGRPEYIRKRFRYEEPEDIYSVIRGLVDIDDILESQLRYWQSIHHIRAEVFLIKKRLRHYTPTALETTMTRSQLYEAGSPMWANGLEISCIEKICVELRGGFAVEAVFAGLG
jgi:hypothetical protein